MSPVASRIERVAARLEEFKVDALLVTNLTNVRYLTGFSGSNGQVLVGRDEAVFFSDGRYAQRAAALVEGAEISIYPNRLTERLEPRLEAASVRRLGIEAGTMTIAERDQLADRLSGIELVPTTGVVEDLRRLKDAGELEALRRAVALGDETFVWILERIAPGRTEREVALDLEIRMRSEGAEAVAFEPIVASGELSAHIHHTPGDRELRKGDLVLLDFGCRVGGYCSDLTRTVVLGPADDDQREIYGLVHAAQAAGIAAAGTGVGGRDADAAARRLISDAGRVDLFGHGLGHGVGLDVHEAPRLHRMSEDTLAAGDVVTVEPGVYLPDWGGIRIEDCVLVADPGVEVLGSAPKEELIEL